MLCEAHGEFHRGAQCRAIRAPGFRTADIANGEAHSAPDRGICAIARAQRHQAAIHAETVANGTVYDEHRRSAHGCGHHAVNVELIRADGFDCGNHHR